MWALNGKSATQALLIATATALECHKYEITQTDG